MTELTGHQGAINLATFFVYGGLYVTFFYQAVILQGVLGYSALGAGLAGIPGGEDPVDGGGVGRRLHVAARIESAVRKVLATGMRTADIALPGEAVVGTRAMGDAVVAAL